MYSLTNMMQAFDIIMSMYYAKYPNSILGLIKYAYNIKAMSTQFGFHMTRSYDETFRRVDKVMGFDWAVVNNELWRTALYEHVNTSQASSNNNNYKSNRQVGNSPFPRRVQQQNSLFPPGFCWAYCRTGGCSNFNNCRLKHQCVQCASEFLC
jgi:hypothetical protein